jgi:hypothetical protein
LNTHQFSITAGDVDAGLTARFIRVTYLKTRREVAVAALDEDTDLFVTGSPDGLLQCVVVQTGHDKRRAARKSKPFRAFDGDHALQIVRGGVPLEVA